MVERGSTADRPSGAPVTPWPVRAGRGIPHRGRTAGLLWLLTAAASGSLAAACAGPTGPSGTPSAPVTAAVSPSGTAQPVDLTIVVSTDAGTQTWRLTCAPPGGTHPDPETACRVLAQNGERALPPVPKGRICTQIYGGPETATITGTWNGRVVLSTLSRRNGCEIGRWEALVGLLPRAGG